MVIFTVFIPELLIHNLQTTYRVIQNVWIYLPGAFLAKFHFCPNILWKSSPSSVTLLSDWSVPPPRFLKLVLVSLTCSGVQRVPPKQKWTKWSLVKFKHILNHQYFPKCLFDQNNSCLRFSVRYSLPWQGGGGKK